jgi:DNA repair photolyase
MGDRGSQDRGPKGRGAAENPPNRFERLAYEPDPETSGDESSSPRTMLFRDSTRSIVARNNSPDVGFDVSVNPYRGCENGCCYCISGDTPILMADGLTKRMEDIRRGDEIYGTRRSGWYRRYVRTKVLTQWRTVKPAYRVTLADGTELVTSGDHRFLTERGWKFVTGAERGPECRPHLTTNNKLMGVGAFNSTPPEETEEYKRGYLCGMIRGDAYLGVHFYEREGCTHGNQNQFRLALIDSEAIARSRRYLSEFDISTNELVFQQAVGSRNPMTAIRTSARRSVMRIDSLIAWPLSPSEDWTKGFLAGIFDAEGSYCDGALRIANTDEIIVDRIAESLSSLRFGWTFDMSERANGTLVNIRVTGGLREHLRFFNTVGTAITRKRDFEGQTVTSRARLQVRSIEPLGVELPLYDIMTGTGDFIANGVVSHNCYARPTHEYLGFSAGLDFESRIMVKEDAPELLRKELSSPRWEPQPISMSGVTDPYQPIERKLRVTRRCLEVLVDFRNPVVMITKSALIARDVDLLGELASHNAAAAILSVTTLDPELARVLEPRAATPERRLEAIRALANAGIPVGVFAAPIIPALTDHEIPAILAAAAAAGASFAGFTIVRLPGAVGPLFEEWLERHRPERKEKVLNRLRSMRGGELNDSRFGVRMRGEGAFAAQIRGLFAIAKKKAGLDRPMPDLSIAAFRRPPSGGQMTLF